MTVSIAREAEVDLEQIADFIAIDSPARAITFVQDLVAQCQALSAHPLRHGALEGYGGMLRRFPYKGYSIYYRVSDNGAVVIVHILHDALDHDPLLGG